MTVSSHPAILPAPPAPTYSEISHTLRLLDGEPAKRVRDMMSAIFQHSAEAQEQPVDWADPDSWIEAPLPGELGTLARKLWEGSGRTLNPRHLYAYHRFAMRLRLLEQVAGTYRLSERGRLFLAGDKAILQELVALRTSLRRADRTPSLESEPEY